MNNCSCFSGKASRFSSLLPGNSYNDNDLKNAAKKLAADWEFQLIIMQARDHPGLMDQKRFLSAL
jgi:hypothetical protein